MSTKSQITKRIGTKGRFEPRSHFLSIDRLDSFPSFNDFQQEFDNLLRNFHHSLSIQSGEFNNVMLNPAVDIVEDDQNIKVELEMPGVDENDIKVSIDNHSLIIKANKNTSKKNEGKNYAMREISYGAYERVISLPDDADIDKAESSFKKGMLWINIPKKPADKSKIRELEIKKAL